MINRPHQQHDLLEFEIHILEDMPPSDMVLERLMDARDELARIRNQNSDVAQTYKDHTKSR